ncbi:hypothetical protein M9H77_23804 [Catharanthus roseus]|uniref:Uncharacterized protein n=1 Tax=Catharanthus roseus TaxID=4058 RepID=A0ACC0AUS6_CATRO|nr:hypothetical protein M9H77_23804 [Catharanthus roseus]
MEEVPYVHPGPIVPDVLSRQHEHRSGLIWSGDHETCFTDLQSALGDARQIGEALVLVLALRPQLITDFVWLAYLDRALVLSDLCWAEVPLICYEIVEYHYPKHVMRQDGPALAVEVLSYPSNEYIRWYWGITRVYIGNPANRDTSLLEWTDG